MAFISRFYAEEARRPRADAGMTASDPRLDGERTRERNRQDRPRDGPDRDVSRLAREWDAGGPGGPRFPRLQHSRTTLSRRSALFVQWGVAPIVRERQGAVSAPRFSQRSGELSSTRLFVAQFHGAPVRQDLWVRLDCCVAPILRPRILLGGLPVCVDVGETTQHVRCGLNEVVDR